MTATGGLSQLYKTWEEPLDPGQHTEPASVDGPTWPAPRPAADSGAGEATEPEQLPHPLAAGPELVDQTPVKPSLSTTPGPLADPPAPTPTPAPQPAAPRQTAPPQSTSDTTALEETTQGTESELASVATTQSSGAGEAGDIGVTLSQPEEQAEQAVTGLSEDDPVDTVAITDQLDEPALPGPSGELAVAASTLTRPELSAAAAAPFRPIPTGLADTSVVHARQLQRRQRPTTGFRAWAYRASGGRVNLGKTAAELAHAELLKRIARPLHTGLGAHHIAIASLKGGVGKTTVGACLGLTLAEVRTDRVASVDVNLHAGTLHDRLIGTEVPTATIQHLLDNLDEIDSINDIDRYQASAGRLACFAGDNDPAAGEAFAGDDYDNLIAILNRFYNIILADCGTGLAEPAMQATLRHTDSLVVVTTPTVDAASRASQTLEWLSHIGYGDLVDTAIVVFSHDHTSAEVDARALRAHLAGNCAHVVDIPFDDHLSAGGHIDLGLADTRARQAYLNLAALIADNFCPDNF